jgi:hypothetical protein
MLAVSIALVLAGPSFTPAQPWALGFASPPRLPFCGDVDGDGYADLIVVYPPGSSIIDVNLTQLGKKSAGGIQALNPWGKDCEAATVGEFDDVKGADVIGLFERQTLSLAGSFSNTKFKNTAEWARLPAPVVKPVLASLAGGRQLLVISTVTGRGYRIESKTRTITPVNIPKGLTWVGDAGDRLVAQDSSGTIIWLNRETLKKVAVLGKAPRGSRPAAAKDLVVFGDKAWTPSGIADMSACGLPQADTVRAIADVDNDGDLDVVEFRYGVEKHTANQILLRRMVSPGELDPDHDGLTNEEEANLGTDPINPDTDNDGLLDGWEVKGFRGLELPKLGCSPTHTDVICLISRFEGVKEEHLKSEMERARNTYAQLATPNPDGKPGFAFHPIYLDPIKGEDTKNAWPVNRDKFRPKKWKGLVHWMQVTPGGGGQADQLGDGGTCGEGALWAVFIHEFGHQMGMDHEGFWPNFLCPTYTSLMNYAYSYSFEDDGNKIHYSDGSLKDYVLRETDLDETIPLPYEKVKFLEKGPYRFRLKANGPTTLIDWNWNGVFGEKHVRADINYSYSTNAGRRDDVGKTMTAPWLFTHEGSAYVLAGSHGYAPDPSVDPTASALRPCNLVLRKLKKPFEWEAPVTVEVGGVIGDPVAASFGGQVWTFYQTAQGVMLRQLRLSKSRVAMTEATVFRPDKTLVPTVAVYEHRLFVFLTAPNGKVTYRSMDSTRQWSRDIELDAHSTNPVGLCSDTLTGEAIIGMAQDQDKDRTHRWQIRRYRLKGETLVGTSMEWIEGEKGGSRGVGRVTVLFEKNGNLGRVLLYGKGLTSAASPWSCTYVAEQIADKSVRGGWLVKRYYDEWTQSRSAPAATWFKGDVLWAYRWVDATQGPTDNNLHVGYRGLGIEDAPMGDHDDLTYFRTFGIRNSILSLGSDR